MTTVTRVEESGPRTVRFGRRSSRGLLLGLSTARVVALVAAFLIVLACLYAGGAPALLWSSPVWAGSVAAAFAPVAGRRAVE